MGWFTGLKNLSGSASPNGGSTDGGGLFAKLFREHPDLLQGGGGQQQYVYDPSTQQFKGMKKGGKVSSASKRADGIAQKGKTKGRFV